jgi:WD40 repeat protein
LAWSPNGLYLASSGKDDQIIIWETEGRQPVAR